MGTTTSPMPAPRTGTLREADVPASTGAPKKRVKWPLFGLCLLVAIAGALGAASLVSQAGDRVQVLAVARDVPAGHRLEAGDLVTASIAKDPALTPVRASQRKSIVGQRTAVDLRRGSLLTRSQLTAGGGVGDDKQLVGVELKRGQAPRDALAPGDRVLAVTIPADGEKTTADGQEPTSINATVVSVGPADAAGTVTVNLAVATTDGTTLAAQAAAKQIALVREPRS
ncbi:SAF domain-containing protein [Streptomyces mordarskii]|uniref:SAF domain-containing protein n=1 Tax=Streptomyces mordarskii TaxID=1226758 RepID=A0ABN1EU21_9ACTN